MSFTVQYIYKYTCARGNIFIKRETNLNTQMANYKNIKKVGLAIICFEGTEHLYNIISAIRESVDYVSVGL